jgi:hypothetical protein
MFQVMFMLYMVIAALLLVNMLIAMMGTTYQGPWQLNFFQ